MGMETGIDYRAVQPQLYEAMHGLQERIDGGELEPGLLEMVRLRASQINGCSFCVNLHSNAAREAGESDARLHMVAAWQHARSFTARERAALRWCETITRLADAQPTGEALAELRQHFTDAEIVTLTWAVAAINAWNRVAVPLGRLGGPPAPRAAAPRAEAPTDPSA
jgi:AhpD family alkylhydroperoxidase